MAIYIILYLFQPPSAIHQCSIQCRIQCQPNNSRAATKKHTLYIGVSLSKRYFDKLSMTTGMGWCKKMDLAVAKEKA